MYDLWVGSLFTVGDRLSDGFVLGIDPSIRGTAVSVSSKDKSGEGDITVIELLTGGAERADLRFFDLGRALRRILKKTSPRLVVLEGFSFGSRGSAQLQLASLGGVFRYELFNGGYPFIVVPPTTLKKFFTGGGRASKEEVVSKANERYRLSLSKARHNSADAIAAMTLGLDFVRGVPDAVCVVNDKCTMYSSFSSK